MSVLNLGLLVSFQIYKFCIISGRVAGGGGGGGA